MSWRALFLALVVELEKGSTVLALIYTWTRTLRTFFKTIFAYILRFIQICTRRTIWNIIGACTIRLYFERARTGGALIGLGSCAG